MNRIFDIVTAMLLFVPGLYIVWFTYVFDRMTCPMLGSPPWGYWFFFVAGGALSVSAVALFRWRRPPAIIGSLMSLTLAIFLIPTRFPNIRMPSEYGLSIWLLLAGAVVFLRFARPSSRVTAVT